MKPLLILMVCVVASIIGTPVSIAPKDIVGTWWTKLCDKYEGRYDFRPDFTYNGSCADMFDGGKWKLHQGGKLELISYSDFEKKTISDKSSRDIVVINRFAKKVMHVTLWDGKKDVWTKR
jgi:hypothetical protein